MEINILTKNIEEDFANLFEAIVDKFKIENKSDFKNELLEFIDSLKLKGTNDIEKLSEEFFSIIEKYSTSEDNLIDIANKEREKWQKE